MTPPTARQLKVLSAIRAHIEEYGMPPTVRELMDLLNIGTTNGVAGHLKLLRKKGLLTWEPHQARTLRLIVDKSLPLVTLESLSVH